ncbi:hypothetical protein MPF19_02215 [Polaribacter sp. Z014]|uniref:hypothetical protein n=1 Tax=Polaribacter sp. Z014 TaxID=2927126 RepID=UPI002020C609|nr:hypothetical protein [Polaribacter sp. Z014]MCL7762214.1 hypothetical protein [Polaribacter sp. Z014]
MNILEQVGKKRTIQISISILLVSLHTIYFYHSAKDEFDTSKFMTQMIRFSLTVALLYFLYKGQKWAKIVSIILFSLGTLGAVFGFFAIDANIINKIPFLVMIFVYATAIYHFAFAKSFKAFYSYQNQLEKS